MEILIGEDDYNLEMKKNFKLKPRVKSWRNMKVFTLAAPRVHATTETESDLSEAVVQTGRYFAELGAEVIELEEDLLLSAFKLWMAGASAVKGRDFNQFLNPLGPIDFGKEFLKIAMGRGDYTFPALLTAYLEIKAVKETDMTPWYEELMSLRARLHDQLGESGILLLPPHPRKAPKHNAALITPFDFCYTGVFNALKFPASVAPTGLATNGLPLGVQIVAGEDQDHLCLSAAEAVEEAFGGWQMAMAHPQA
jgi:fatty acid amide hydrolase 2